MDTVLECLLNNFHIFSEIFLSFFGSVDSIVAIAHVAVNSPLVCLHCIVVCFGPLAADFFYRIVTLAPNHKLFHSYVMTTL